MSNHSSTKPQGKAYAVLFAVEKYMESGLDTVLYAERDATEVAKALGAIGYESADIALFLNEKATKTTIEYETVQLAKSAAKEDTVFFFFAGHGYTWEGRNYLLAYDTRRGDIVGTAVPLHRLFELFEESGCRQVMFFLDCCHSGLHLADEARGVLEEMSREELQSYFDKADFRVVFSSCDKGEFSYPSTQFQHGYWTYHLLRALRGDEPGVLDEARRLRSTQLQDYLRVEVPKQLALQSSVKRRQNPKMFGDASGTFVIADLGSLLANADAELKLKTLGLKHTTLRGSETGYVKDLDGFNKVRGHTVPKFVSSRTRDWVAEMASGNLKSEMERYFASVKKAGAYDNKSLKYDPPTEGGAAIRTPDFEFSITYSQNDDDPGEYEVARELLRLNTPALLEEDWFNKLFEDVFDEALFEFSGTLDVNAFIDKAEKIQAFALDYDGERTKCNITMDGFDGAITVTRNSLIYEFYSASTPKEMASELQEVHTLLLTMPGMQKALPL